MRSLVVEDNTRLRSVVCRTVGRAGLACDEAESIESAEELIELHRYDIIILDRRLPDGDGLDICRSARDRGFAGSILMLTALDDAQSTVEGLSRGADDYLGKPFDLDVLEARVKALLRRSSRQPVEELRFGDLVLDPWKRILRAQGRELHLTARELGIMEALLRSGEGILSRDQLMEQAWGERDEPMSNTIDVLVSRIRGKLKKSGSTTAIDSVRGLGYRLRP